MEDVAAWVHQEIKTVTNGNRVAWVHRELLNPAYFGKEHLYYSTRERFVIDCAKAEIEVTDIAYYSGRYATGVLVAQRR